MKNKNKPQELGSYKKQTLEINTDRQRWFDSMVERAKKKSTTYDDEFYTKPSTICSACNKQFYQRPLGLNSKIVKGMKFCSARCHQMIYRQVRNRQKRNQKI